MICTHHGNLLQISLLATGEGASGVTFCASNPAAGLALVLYGITTCNPPRLPPNINY